MIGLGRTQMPLWQPTQAPDSLSSAAADYEMFKVAKEVAVEGHVERLDWLSLLSRYDQVDHSIDRSIDLAIYH